ncbi:hypothetical protein ACFQZ0_02415 [Streptomyces erythrogriseus]
MAEDPVRRPDAALGYESPWQGVLFLLGFSALFALVAVVCSVLAFFLRGWQTGCLVLVGVVAPAVLVNLARDKVVEITGSRARDAGAPGRPVPADAPDQPSVWVVVSALTVLLGVLGFAGTLAGLVAFLVSGWDTAFLLLGAGPRARSSGSRRSDGSGRNGSGCRGRPLVYGQRQPSSVSAITCTGCMGAIRCSGWSWPRWSWPPLWASWAG